MRCEGGQADHRPGVVQHQARDRRARLRGERHADQAAHRGAEPAHRLDVEAGDQRHHVGDVLRHGVELGVGEAVGVAAPGDVGADHAPAAAQRARQVVEIAAVARQAVHAHQHVAVARVAPLEVRHAVQPLGRGALHRAAPRLGYALQPFLDQQLARLAAARVERGIAPAAGAQPGQLLRLQVGAAHRKAVAGVALALERRPPPRRTRSIPRRSRRRSPRALRQASSGATSSSAPSRWRK